MAETECLIHTITHSILLHNTEGAGNKSGNEEEWYWNGDEWYGNEDEIGVGMRKNEWYGNEIKWYGKVVLE